MDLMGRYSFKLSHNLIKAIINVKCINYHKSKACTKLVQYPELVFPVTFFVYDSLRLSLHFYLKTRIALLENL